jgi:hypothetical protein
MQKELLKCKSLLDMTSSQNAKNQISGQEVEIENGYSEALRPFVLSLVPSSSLS